MTYAPATLSALARFWIAQNGTMLGIVGNKAHTKGYHLGKDRIFDGGGPGIGWDDYSVKLPRDKAGLSNAASGIDLGRLDGTLRNLRSFSKWLVAQCRADTKAYRDIREVIYSPDGVYVKRWSHVDERMYTSLRRNPGGSITVITPGNGDASHFTHTHISFYRDSVARSKVPLFAGYFAPATPDTATGDAVRSFLVPEQRTLAKIRDGAWLYQDSSLAANPENINLSPSRELVLVGVFDAGVRIVAYEPRAGDVDDTSKALFVAVGDVLSTRIEPDLTPYDKAQVDAAYNEGRDAVVNAAATVPRR